MRLRSDTHAAPIVARKLQEQRESPGEPSFMVVVHVAAESDAEALAIRNNIMASISGGNESTLGGLLEKKGLHGMSVSLLKDPGTEESRVRGQKHG